MAKDILTSTFIRFRERLRNVAAGIVGSDDAEDIIHDAFCRLWSRHQIVNTETEAMKLSYTAVKNSAIDSLRRRNSHPKVSIDDTTQQISSMTDDADECKNEKQLIYNTVIAISHKYLSERQFEIFRLHDIEGVGYEEVAAILSMTPENVRVTLSRTRKMIRELYRKHNAE